MHVFVTGGTGTIGTPVVAELLGHHHTVLAFARSDASARALETATRTGVEQSASGATATVSPIRNARPPRPSA